MGEKILVIDDEMHIVELLKFNLEVNGYIVDYSLDSFEGYHKAKELKPNLILLDWMLPNISGIDLLKKIRSDETLEQIPQDEHDETILVVSAHSLPKGLIEKNIKARDWFPFREVNLFGDISKLENTGFRNKYSLIKGLEKTYKYNEEHDLIIEPNLNEIEKEN